MAQVGCAGILVEDTFCGPMQELPREGQLLVLMRCPPGSAVALLTWPSTSPNSKSMSR